MEKLKKIFFPVDIALGVLIVAMIVLIVLVNVNKGSTNFSPSDKAAQNENTEGGSTEVKTSFDGFDTSADANVEIENPILTDANGFFLPKSNTDLVTESDLSGLNAECLYYAKCEIYARHGYVFSDGDAAKTYFAKKTWYSEDPDFDLSTLSEIETTNYTFIENYMTTNNLTYTP